MKNRKEKYNNATLSLLKRLTGLNTRQVYVEGSDGKLYGYVVTETSDGKIIYSN